MREHSNENSNSKNNSKDNILINNHRKINNISGNNNIKKKLLKIYYISNQKQNVKDYR